MSVKIFTFLPVKVEILLKKLFTETSLKIIWLHGANEKFKNKKKTILKKSNRLLGDSFVK